MEYDDPFEREMVERWWRWQDEARFREIIEERLTPDDRLDDLGWDIFYAAIARGLHDERAARLAMDGNYRQRRRVRDDMYRRLALVTRRRWAELHPDSAGLGVWETQAADQLGLWHSRLVAPRCVYFIQSGPHGPVKIGWTGRDPHERLRKLQTGNPEELLLRHVIPGDRMTERQLLATPISALSP